jgi:hypothetical protein
MRPYSVSDEDAAYLTAVLKGDGQPLFRRGRPENPARDESGKPFPVVDAMALQEEAKRNEEDLASNVQSMAGEPEVEVDGAEPPQEGEEAPRRRARRKKME